MNPFAAAKKFRPIHLLSLLVFFGLSVLCGLLIGQALVTLMPEGVSLRAELLTLAALLPMFLIAFYVQIILHEGGHLVFGLLTGYGFSSFRIGSLMLLREDGTLRLKRHSLAGTGGQCLMTPPPMQDGKIPYALYNLGGCLMNFLSALLCILLKLLIPNPIAGAILLVLALTGLLLAFTNGIPLITPQIANDGSNLRSIRRDPEALRAFFVQMKIVEQTARGVRLREMPEEWFTLPDGADLDDPLISSVAVFACNRAMDEGDPAAADRQMAALMDSAQLLGLHRSLLLNDRLFCELVGENRPEVREALRTKELLKFQRSMPKNPSVLRTNYAWALLAERDAAAAEQQLTLFEKAARTYPYPSDIASERELLVLAAQKENENG